MWQWWWEKEVYIFISYNAHGHGPKGQPYLRIPVSLLNQPPHPSSISLFLTVSVVYLVSLVSIFILLFSSLSLSLFFFFSPHKNSYVRVNPLVVTLCTCMYTLILFFFHLFTFLPCENALFLHSIPSSIYTHKRYPS